MSAFDRKIQEILRHYQYAVQAAMETEMDHDQEDGEDLQTKVGLYLQDTLRELAVLQETEFQEEMNFYSVRPVHKVQGLLL